MTQKIARDLAALSRQYSVEHLGTRADIGAYVLENLDAILTALRAQQAQPVAGWEPTMAAICGRCGDNYGSHAGNDCPDRKGKFAPSLAQTRPEVVEECAKACDKAATEIEAMAIYQHSEYLKGAAAESRSRAIALRALAPAIQQGKETKNG